MSMLTPSPSCILGTGVDGYYSAIPPYALIAIGICIGVIGTLCTQKIMSPRESKWVINNFKVDGARTTTYSEINFMGPGSVREHKRNSRNSIEMGMGEVYFTNEQDLKKISVNRIPYSEEYRNSGKPRISSGMWKLHPKRAFYVSPRMKKMGSGLSEEDEKCERLSALRSSSNLCNLRISSTGPGSGYSASSLQCVGDYRQPEGSSLSMLQFPKNNRPSTIANHGSNEINLSADPIELHMEGSSCRSREDTPRQSIHVVGEDKTQVLSLTSVESSENKPPGANSLAAKTLSDWAIARDTTTSVNVGADEGAPVSPNSMPLQGEISVAFPEIAKRLASCASSPQNPSYDGNIIPIVEAPSLNESSTIEPFGVEVGSSNASSDDEKESKASIFLLDKQQFRRSTQLLSNDSYLTIASTNSNLLLATPGPPNRDSSRSRRSSPDRGSNRMSSLMISNSKPFISRQFKANLSLERNKPVSISPFPTFSEGGPQSFSFDPGAYSFTSDRPLVVPFLDSEKTSNRLRLEV